MDHNILTAANEKERYTVALHFSNDILGVKRRKNSSDYPPVPDDEGWRGNNRSKILGAIK